MQQQWNELVHPVAKLK